MNLVNHYICYSGGADGADSYFELFSNQFQVQLVAYSYKTKYHQSVNKKELTVEEFKEGVAHVYKANEVLKRSKINPYLNLLARNWLQVKNADEVYAISTLKNFGSSLHVKGGTAWAVQMAIDSRKKVFVYDQDRTAWFYYDEKTFSFKELKEAPRINAHHFAGIGTRNINMFGIAAIEELFINTFQK